MKKLYLLDAYALIFRAHFAFIRNPRINSKGLNTSAIFGFVNSLLEVLNKENPTHLAVVFDIAGRTVREEIYAEYKANRDETPEDIRLAVPYIHKILEAMNIPSLGVEGYEADDVIGTLAKKAEKAGFQTYMVTPDKDYAQLVSENIFMWRPGRSGNPAEIWDVEKVKEKFEVERPEQVIDILGLWGDAVDNIPGIPGIGEKTSKKLVAQYGSVEGLLAHTDELKGKQKENVINFAEQGLLSKKLATIILDVPVELDETALVVEEPNSEKVTEVFSELEFRTLLKKVVKDEDASLVPTASPSSDDGQMSLFGGNGEQSQEDLSEFKSFSNSKNVNYTLVTDEKGLKSALKTLSKYSSVCFDTETSSLDELNTKLLGIALSGKKGEAWYVAMPQEFNARSVFRKELQEFFSNEKVEKVAHNVKFDLKVLMGEKIEVKGKLFDTMVAHYLLEPEQRHNMDVLAEVYLQYQPVSIETLIGPKGKNQKSMADLDPSEISDYACEDADVTYQLYELFKQKVAGSYLEKLFYDVEMPLVRVLMEMELEGINLDVPALNDFSEELNTQLIELQERIIDAAGVEFNVDSPRQLGDVLFETMKLNEKAKKTKTGQYKTDEAILSKLQGKHPIIDDILEYRQMKKLKSTYVDALPKLVNPKTGRIHTTYFQTVAATGRLSSNNPNLQNIPIRSTRGKEIRKAFKARSAEYKIMAADYSQIELRIIAALSKDQGMIEAFRSGQDIHAATAAKVFGVALDEVTREQRSKAKMVNFGIIYGISAFGLAQRLGISRTEAKEIIDSYFEQYGRIKEYMDESIEFARKHEYVETILKRRRYLAKINAGNGMERGFAERNAINAPIQGSAADVIKVAMINVQERMKKEQLKSKLLLQVHDELVFDAHESEVDLLKQLAKEEMERAIELEVPLEVEAGVADNWLDAH